MTQSVKKRSTDFSEIEMTSDDSKPLLEAADSVEKESESVEEGIIQEKSEGAADGEHTCSECGMVFQRRYALIMHTLKHEKSRGFKCPVRIE